jgi:hypothetical protein
MRMSHNHQTTWVVWILSPDNSQLTAQDCERHVMRLSHRAIEVLDHPDLYLTRFVDQRIFPKCDHVLVS